MSNITIKKVATFNCFVCFSNEDVKKIKIEGGNGLWKSLTLCKTCRRTLQNKLQEEVVNEFEEQNE